MLLDGLPLFMIAVFELLIDINSPKKIIVIFLISDLGHVGN